MRVGVEVECKLQLCKGYVTYVEMVCLEEAEVSHEEEAGDV